MESVQTLETTTFRGRRFTRAQLARVQETVETFPNLSRHALASTLCEHLDWTTPKGSYKISSCLKLLDELERLGIVRLPAKREMRVQVRAAIELKKPEAEISTGLDDLGRIVLEPVRTEERGLWKSYVESHHYLGYKRPVGAHLLYFIVSESLRRKVGCMSFAAAQVRILAPRDQWIGWDKHHREKLLRLVLCQNRFLIFPWVQVKNLGSKVLALSAKQVGDDWVRIHGYRPVLIETFVDTSQFSGASYRAANWQYLGETQGRGRDPKRESTKPPKAIFAYPLQSNWRQCLTEGHRAVELKKRYRNDLQSSRTRSVGDGFVSMWKEVVDILHDVAAEYDETWRVRKRVIDSLILMLLIFRLVTSKNFQSYGTTIDDLWDSCDKLGLALPQHHSIAPSSFCAARKKLDENIFKCVNQRILNAYAPDSSHYAWFGHRLFAVDGSKLNLPRQLIACGYKTPSDHASYPQGLLSCLYQLKSQLPYDWDLVSHANERLCAEQHLSALQHNDVVVYDRGYFSYVMLHGHCTAGVHAIFRLQESSYAVIRDFVNSPQTDTLVTIYPSEHSLSDIREKHPELDVVPLKMRLLKYEIAGSMSCLGTTLVEPHQHYPLQEFIDVYHSRWGVEELYKISKRIFTIEDFHGRTERGVKQELFAHFVLVTMNRLFANRADTELNRAGASTPSTEQAPPSPMPGDVDGVMGKLKTNFKNCVHVVARNLEELLLLHGLVKTVVQRVFNSIMNRHQRVRPGRSYARKSMRPDSKWHPNKRKKRNRSKQQPAPIEVTAAPA